jgi:uncharacterized membrane protein YphA (DoxX/SURF4 family)
VAGRLFDRLIFRPLIGWATAWSFDRLRLWLEQDVAPDQAIRQSLIHAISRVAIAAIFMYHGLIPKVLTRNVDEIAMVRDAGLAAGVAGSVVTALGILELSFAAALLVAWHRRWPLFVCFGLMLVATAAVGINSPRYFSAAFNPFTLTSRSPPSRASTFLSWEAFRPPHVAGGVLVRRKHEIDL